jgi:type II secretory pathway component PulF
MLFSSQLPVAALVQWCRAMRHGLHAGLSPVKVFRTQAKNGHTAARAVAGQLADRLEKGSSLEDALTDFPGKFPVLFLELTALGERTGRLSETFAELEKHYEDTVATRKQFASALVYPAFMYFMAVGIVALLVFVLGMIPGNSMAPFGKSMNGAAGAVTVLGLGCLTAAAAVVGFLIVRENEPLRGKLEAAALAVPGLGGCFRAFALHRFCVGLHMTAEAGLRADKALRLAFRATANEAFQKLTEPAATHVKKGGTVSEALEPGRGRLFPDEFLDGVHVGEMSGQLPEMMAKQAGIYREEAARQMKVLSRIASGLVYAGVGLMVIVMIVRIAGGVMQPYNDALRAADDPNAWLRGQ